MSTEPPNLDKFFASLTFTELDAMRHQDEQTGRQNDIDFARLMRTEVNKTHAECIPRKRRITVIMVLQQQLTNALTRLEARTAELKAVAEQQYEDRLHLRALADVFTDIESLAPYRTKQGASVDAAQSSKESTDATADS